MALDTDLILDRRRLARRAAFWRGLAFVTIIVALAVVMLTRTEVAGREHIARLPISGAIVSDRPLLQLIDRLKEQDNVRGVIVSINSPGGTSVGGERLYHALRELDGEKPIVAHVTTLGASAAYMAALASDHIVAQRTSLTGSVGVLIQYGQLNRFLNDLGIEVGKVESGALKAEPSPFEPAEPAAVALLQSVVDDSFQYFIGLVEERRSPSADELALISDGRIFTGGQALRVGLVDAIGGEQTAIDWLEDERGIDDGLPVRNYKPRDDIGLGLTARITDQVLNRLFAAAGVPLPPTFSEGSVDGLWSVWHAPYTSDN